MRLLIPKRRFGRDIFNGLLLSGVGLILLIAGGLYMINKDFKESVQTNARIERLSDHLMQLRSAMIDQETGQRGFELTGDEEFLEPYILGTMQFNELVQLINEEKDMPEKLYVALQEVIKRAIYWHDDYAQIQVRKKRFDLGEVSIDELRAGKARFEAFRDAADYAEELQLTAKETAFQELQKNVSEKLGWFGITAVLLILAQVAFLSRRLRQDMENLHVLAESARAYTKRNFDVPVPRRKKKDDLGRLIANIDQMRSELKEKFGLMAQLADLDGLTGIPNRRYLNEQLPKLVCAAKRQGVPFSLVLCDIDYFKRFNDEYGHLEGDRVIKHAAKVLQDGKVFCRMVSRYGGEEFCLLLPGCDLDEARSEAERLRTLIVEEKLPPYAITMSFGVSSLLAEDDEEGTLLLARADKALYQAKANGRNRVE
ncbi:diguanylate cyclase (GGDEF)-like protein [Paenibacillus phyllosphaerae]|uniref:Diguanylate cyclase (GGDEF)-like protein n=1 Tax=Paenibacillus phyllosphaerae TaxID=274593 RepID=A0A7W5B0Q7_9BACL|nr:diguanylate cyclase [Paenibacillus phyllosphaerae]MBB3112320.1 diguanylate cyclase (GGDEF)-like protein [Paenibacillus phyllosphaerae]